MLKSDCCHVIINVIYESVMVYDLLGGLRQLGKHGFHIFIDFSFILRLYIYYIILYNYLRVLYIVCILYMFIILLEMIKLEIL